jgi:ABC-type multidrug transport system fused ATPase/permease subunit
VGHILYFAKKMHAYAGKILYINLLGMGLVSLLDGMGMLLLIPILNISGIFSINTGAIPFMGVFQFFKDYPKSWSLLIILGTYVVLMTGQTLIQRNLSFRDIVLHTGFINHVRLETYRILLQANWGFLSKKRKSDLINSLTDELVRVAGGIQLFLQFLASLVFTLIQIGLAFWLSPYLTIFVLACGLIITLLSRKFIKRSRVLGNQTSELERDYLGGITDHFNGIKDIKGNMLEESRLSWLSSLCRKIEHERYEMFKVSTNSQLFYKVSSTLIIACFIYVSVMLFHIQGAQILMISLIFSRLWPRFTGIQSNLEKIAAAIPAFKALREIQKEGIEAREMNNASYNYKDVKPIRFEYGIECRDVYFRYNRHESLYALQDISLQIQSNRMTAIVGRSGAGKSTLIDILMGLLQPERGQVLIDGAPITSENLFSLRQAISYVPQDPFLFNGSIKENMLMMHPSASEEDIKEALKLAAAAEFVSRLPKGLDTIVGDRGIRLSGGERQRLVLARAILRKPAILVLDEATSALDSENEAKIQEALENLKGTMTIIVIAHRLSTIRNADQVIVLDQGNIIQKGSYSHLAKENGGLFSTFLGNQVPDAKVIAGQMI